MDKGSRPKFLDSPYYKDGKLSKEAPEDLRKEYEEFKSADEEDNLEEVPKLKESDLG